MKHTETSLRRAVFQVFEDECELTGGEMKALTEMFEGYRKAMELKLYAMLESAHDALRQRQEGALWFLVLAGRITDTQHAALFGLLDEVDGVVERR